VSMHVYIYRFASGCVLQRLDCHTAVKSTTGVAVAADHNDHEHSAKNILAEGLPRTNYAGPEGQYAAEQLSSQWLIPVVQPRCREPGWPARKHYQIAIGHA
jgi:hypothetical protein